MGGNAQFDRLRSRTLLVKVKSSGDLETISGDLVKLSSRPLESGARKDNLRLLNVILRLNRRHDTRDTILANKNDIVLLKRRMKRNESSLQKKVRNITD